MVTNYVSLSGATDTEIFKTLIDLVDINQPGSSLADLLSDTGTDTTVFAPTDAAFIAFAQRLGFGGSDEAGALSHILLSAPLLGGGDMWGYLHGILSYHMTAGALDTASLTAPLTGLNGAALGASSSGVVDNDSTSPDALYVVADQTQDNGVLHLVDQVLLPAEIMQSNGLNAVEFVIGTDSADVIVTGDDNDFVNAEDGSDLITLGAGNDIGVGWCGNDTLFGGSGSDRLIGGNGRDMLYGESGNDTLIGGNSNDTLIGAGGADWLRGGNNDDLLQGGGSSDVLAGGNGNDTLMGGAGGDQLTGGAGNDRIEGGSGRDTLFGGEGDDTLSGNSGSDLFVFTKGTGDDVISDFQAVDLIDVQAFGIWSLATLNMSQVGLSTVIHLNANDSVTLENYSIADLNTANFVFDVEPMAPAGSDSADNLAGDATANLIYGGAGSDRINGGAGNDSLFGGTGMDSLNGADGDDLLDGGSGKDRLYGGDGNDTLLGQSDNDVMLGDAGMDDLQGGSGNDRLYGGDDADVISADGGNDKLYGDAGNDTLFGGSGKDLLKGGAGDDRLAGGSQNDTLSGQGGADVFVFLSSGGLDTVTDFEDNTDLFDISAFGFSSLGDFGVAQVGTDVLISLGSGSELLVQNATLAALDASDFIF